MTAKANSLGFRVETISGARIKIRDDGRRGPCVADEAALWDVLQDATQSHEQAFGFLAESVAGEPEFAAGQLLSTAAPKLIARLKRERDEARAQLTARSANAVPIRDEDEANPRPQLKSKR